MPTQAEFAKIHIAKKELCLSDSGYRDMLQSRYNRDSSKGLSDSQVADLLSHFRRLGWKPGVLIRKRASLSQTEYIQVLWGKLGSSGKLRNPSDAGLDSFVLRTVHIEKLQWVTNPRYLSKIIEALKAWEKRPS